MLNILKPYFGPAALISLDIGMKSAGFQINEILSGALIAFALFWFSLTLVSHKALLRKYPGIKDWLPFVDPSGGIRATSKDLTGNYISGQSFVIADLAYKGVIEGRHFENCQIYGPAVIMMDSLSYLNGCSFHGDPNALVIETSNEKLLGIVYVKGCTFKSCILREIGLIGDSKTRAKLKVKNVPNA